MKYLIILSLFLIGCTQDPTKVIFKPVIISNDSSGSITEGLELYHKFRECIYITKLGYIKDQATFDQCRKHFTTPTYKIGQKFKLNNSIVLGTCTFTIKQLIWARGYVMNKPGYSGDQSCVNHGVLVMFIGDQFKQESELTESGVKQ